MSNETKSPDVAQATAELTVQDLGALKQIIDVASQRGAFKPNEMVVVGQTYAKLEAFLNAVKTQQEAATPPVEDTNKGE
tara:strand:+ start:4932 stop:5168 length:237 start_codon:yes stop_codon:yes gene_type:complete